MAMTDEQKKAAGERLKAARAAKAAAKEQTVADGSQEITPIVVTKIEVPARTVNVSPEWLEVIEGNRWIHNEDGPYGVKAERISFRDASGFDNNFAKRALATMSRCLAAYLNSDGTPCESKLPEFSNEMQFEVSVRFVPK